MAEAAGYLIEAIAKAVEDARKSAAAPQTVARPAPAGGGLVPARVVASRGATARQGDVAARDATGASTPAEPPRPFGLLAAFRAGEGLLSGFILAEALSPPVALRGESPRPR